MREKAQDASWAATGQSEGHRRKSHADPVCPPFRPIADVPETPGRRKEASRLSTFGALRLLSRTELVEIGATVDAPIRVRNVNVSAPIPQKFNGFFDSGSNRVPFERQCPGRVRTRDDVAHDIPAASSLARRPFFQVRPRVRSDFAARGAHHAAVRLKPPADRMFKPSRQSQTARIINPARRLSGWTTTPPRTRRRTRPRPARRALTGSSRLRRRRVGSAGESANRPRVRAKAQESSWAATGQSEGHRGKSHADPV